MLFGAQKGKTSRWLEATAQKRRAEREEAEAQERESLAARQEQEKRLIAQAEAMRMAMQQAQHQHAHPAVQAAVQHAQNGLPAALQHLERPQLQVGHARVPVAPEGRVPLDAAKRVGVGRRAHRQPAERPGIRPART